MLKKQLIIMNLRIRHLYWFRCSQMFILQTFTNFYFINYILLKGFPVFQIRRILILGFYQDLYVYIVVCATICKVLNLSLKCFRQELELSNRRALSVSKYYRVFLFSNNVLSFIYNTADFLSIVFLIQWYLFGTAVCCSI